MDRPSSRKLLHLSGALADGSCVDWDTELQAAPGLASQLKRLRQLEAIGNAHRSLAESDFPPMAASADRPVGEGASARFLFRWGHLNVLDQVGRGSFGEVYRAVDSRLRREVALKLRRIQSPVERSSARRFLDEARGLARIRHPNVVVVYGADVHEGRIGFWTDFIRGKTLATRLAEGGPIGEQEAILVGVDLCRALAAVHAAGLIHGDVKAANAMREETGRIVLMDFGASSAWPRGDESGRGAGRAAMGTPLAMAPEVLVGKAAQPASDLYSLAVLLHQLVSGRYPVEAESLNQLRKKHARGDRIPLHALRPELSPALVQVIERGLSTDPQLRYQTAGEMESALLAVMGSPAERRHTLPAEPDLFIGRETELAELGRELESGSRLVTLVGPGGMGKTRLAMAHGWQGLETWPGGVWFCDLTEAKGLDGVVGAVAVGLDVPLGKEDPVEQLGHAIAGRGRCLVMLDNFEQVVDQARATVSRWLARAADARFVVTSRERLNVPGETLLAVEPLPLESGVELFMDRARRQGAKVELDESTAGSVAELVRWVEGIPLAIELAAARVRVLTPAQIVERMRDRFRVLSSGRGDAVEADRRHGTLRAAIDGSWELLRPWEKSAFAQCSVFQGGFTLEAAEAVLDLEAWPEAPWVVDVVQSLVDKTLLRRWEPGASVGVSEREMRFNMYVSLQEYARMKLRESGAVWKGGSGLSAERSAEERHGKWYAQYGTEESIKDLGLGGGGEEWRRFERELENLSAACRRAAVRGEVGIAVKAYRASWAAVEQRGPFGAAVELGREILSHLRPGGEEGAIVLRTLGLAEWYSGDMNQARMHLDAALAMAREIGNRRLEGDIRFSLGGLHTLRGEIEEGRGHLEMALAIARERGDRAMEGVILGTLGVADRQQGRLDEARAFCEEALAIHREAGHRRFEGIVLGNLGLLHEDQGRVEEARPYYEQALAIHREVGHRRFEGVILGNLGNLHYLQSQMDKARANYEAALAITRAVGHRSFEGIVLFNLGKIHWDQGRMDEALDHYESGLAILREVRHRRFEGIVLGELGVLYYDRGRIEEAWNALQAGEALLRQTGDRIELGKLLCARAGLEHRSGNDTQARSTFTEAEALANLANASPDSEFRRELAKLRQALMPESSAPESAVRARVPAPGG